MKVKVLTGFYDTAAKIVRKRGDMIDVTPDRFNEIQNQGNFLEASNHERMNLDE